MTRNLANWIVGSTLATAGLAAFVGCQQTQENAPLSSLRRSGDVAFVCVGPDGQGAPLKDCSRGPGLEFGGATVGKPDHELFALVTQTVSGEVAVVRVTGAGDRGRSDAEVVDVDPSNPGVTPLRVGQQPTAITTTRGGHASFVGVGEVGREGIFALPTSCLGAPGDDETIRDLTTWPACALSSPPGAMLLVVDPSDEEGRQRMNCSGDYLEELPEPASAQRAECSVDLRNESTVAGRQKIYVTLPEEGRIVVLDAQALLDRQPGSFASCFDASADQGPRVFQGELRLEVELPSSIVQPLPDDLVAEGCSEQRVEYGPFPGPFQSRPTGMAERDGSLVVADRGAPVVHQVDVRDPCDPLELPPLLATSFERPDRVVTTSDVAISPPTEDGKQYVYAIDELGEDHASLMAFDVSEGSGSRTPIVRPGSVQMPLEPPDRIEFNAPVKDVEFAAFDLPIADAVTGAAAFGVECNPDPSISADAPGARYRPSSDFTSGARPALLRGLFAYALLSDASLGLIDIEDFDAACRRPVQGNSLPEADFRGCSSDPARVELYTDDGTSAGAPTVTNEVSCQIVQPHRARSGRLLLRGESDALEGAEAPGLAAFGRLGRLGRGLPVSRLTVEGRRRPIMLGVDFDSPIPGASEPAQVFVGNVFRSRVDAEDPLVVDPNEAEQISMVLPYRQPRAYPREEVVTATYEGAIAGELNSGRLQFGTFGDRDAFTLSDQPALVDAEATYCEFGVQDVAATQEVAQEQFSLSGPEVARFGRRHADYVQVTSELLVREDPYWESERGSQCGSADPNGSRGYFFCDARFGDGDGEDVLSTRDLRIVRAYQNELVVEPRSEDDTQRLYEELQCCFPQVVDYRIRTGRQWTVVGSQSGFQHPVVARPVTEDGETRFRCERDCSPLRAQRRGRAFEISNSSCDATNPEAPDACGVGPRTPQDIVCAYDASRGPVVPDGAAADCIFDGLTRRFAIYRGLEPSLRDMTFSFTVNGGFVNQRVSLGRQGQVLPVAMSLVPDFAALGIVDSQDRGLIMVDVRSPRVIAEFF